MGKRVFTSEDLIEWGVANRLHPDWDYYMSPLEFDDPAPVVEDEHSSMGDEEERRRVFVAPDDGKLYSITYECGGSKSGYNEMDPSNMSGTHHGHEVEKKTIEKVVYVRV